jgi:MFS family permease
MGIMSLSEIMDKSIEILRKHVKSIALFTIGYGIIAFIAVFLIIIVGVIASALLAGLLENFWIMGIFLVFIGISAAAFGLSLYAGTIKIASQEYTGEEVFAQDAIKASFKSIFKVFGIIFSAVVLFIPVGAVMGVIGKFFYDTFDRTMLNINLYTRRQLLYIIPPVIFLLVVVFIIVAYIAWFSFALNVLVIEKKGVFGSIKRSFSLIKNNYWRILGCILLFSITVSALRSSIDTVMAAVSGIIYLIFKFLNINQDFLTFFTMVYGYASWPINLVTWMVISPIAVIMISMLYFNQRFKKEGYDIILKLKEIQKNDERKKLSEFNDSL